MIQNMMDESANIKGSLLGLCKSTTSQIVIDLQNLLNDLKVINSNVTAYSFTFLFLAFLYIY